MKDHKDIRISVLVLGALACFAAGTLSTIGYQSYAAHASEDATKAIRLSQTEYPLINPLLLCNAQLKDVNENKALEAKISAFIKSKQADGSVDSMSVYLIDYAAGEWVGVGESDRYDPASLLKVPLMMAYFQSAEKDPKTLEEEIAFKGDDQNVGEYFVSPNVIKPDKFYAVNDLIKSMIVSSDNSAAVLLENNLDHGALTEVYSDLGLPIPEKADTVQFISAKLYAYFFRLLYNGTYLERPFSEKALELLSKSEFPGLKTGLPAGTTVAQKFGERSIIDDTGKVQGRELHDCGFIYRTGRQPYLLCVMSRSSRATFDTMAKNISDLSALVFEELR